MFAYANIIMYTGPIYKYTDDNINKITLLNQLVGQTSYPSDSRTDDLT